MFETLPDSDAVLSQFNRLIQELLRGNMNRNTFRPWEIELLLDIEACNLRDSSKREILRRYQRAVQRQILALETRPRDSAHRSTSKTLISCKHSIWFC